MVSLGNEYVLKFKLGELEDFIDAFNLSTFSLIEDAGVVLPTFKLIFKSSDESIMKYFNEGSNIQVSMGKDNLNLDTTINLMCTSTVLNKAGNDSFLITLAGIYDALDYVVSSKLSISSAQESALTTLNRIVESYFDVDFDPTSSEDSQVYIQPNIPDKKFVLHLLNQAKLSGSAPVSGITSEGKFKVRDIKKLASEPYKWKFVKNVEDESVDIAYESGDSLESSSGLINSLFGYGRNYFLLDYIAGTSSIINETTTSVFSNSSAPSRKGSIVERMGPIVPMNDNMDSDYYKTYLRNAMYNLLCSQFVKTVRFVDVFKKVEVLDKVMYNELSINSEGTLEYTSGNYIVSKVVRNISGGFFQTICELSRESLNNAEGDLR